MRTEVVEFFAGPGGWDEGARLAGFDLDIRGFDISRDAISTARASGHRRTRMDVRVLTPDMFPAARDGHETWAGDDELVVIL